MKLDEIVIELDLLRGTTGGETIINPSGNLKMSEQ